MQILLAVRHNVLIRCVFESILTLFEWAAQQDPQIDINCYFCNSFTVSKLLLILETFADEFRILASDTITYLFRYNSSGDLIKIFRELGGSEKLMGLLMTCSGPN